MILIKRNPCIGKPTGIPGVPIQHATENPPRRNKKGTLVEIGMHALLTQIHSAWKDKNKKKSLLTQLFSWTLPLRSTVSQHQRLFHNLRKRGVCNQIVNLIQIFHWQPRNQLKELPEFSLVGCKNPERYTTRISALINTGSVL